jgi:protein-tyrosine-phosphatase
MLGGALICVVLVFAPLLQAQAGVENQKSALPAKIVFVCEHGSSKSLVAANFCRRIAKERGIDIQVVSRGTAPEASVPAGARNGLQSDGIDIGAFKPTRVSAADLKDAAKVISFGPDLSPFTHGPVEDWSATPAVNDDYNAARNYIRKRLETLLDQFSKPAR